MGATSEEKMRDIKLLTDGITVIPFNDQVALKASEIYHELKRANQLIEFRDIFIVAGCLVYNLVLNTTNDKHFSRINGLVLYSNNR